MPQTRSHKIPYGISNENELKAWFEQEIEKLGDQPARGKWLELLQSANRFYGELKNTNSNVLTSMNDPNPYKGPLVSELMAEGWDIKQGGQKHKELRPDARGVFIKALRLIPENPKACYRLGHLMKKKGDIGEAVGYFSKALELASKQSEFQPDLKLNPAQIDNARGQSIALLQELSGLFEFDYEFTFDPEQIATLQNLLRDTFDRHVVYSTKVGRSLETKAIDSYEYDDLINKFRCDPQAFVIDRYNSVSLIRYLNSKASYEQTTPSTGRLHYLLKALGLEDWETTNIKPNTITKNVLRVKEDLKKIKIDKWVDIAYSETDGESKLTAKCDLTVHYFKTLLD